MTTRSNPPNPDDKPRGRSEPEPDFDDLIDAVSDGDMSLKQAQSAARSRMREWRRGRG